VRARLTRLLPTLSLVVLVGLLLAVDSLAAPGGGSSGFGGGGGGGGGGGFSGGGSGSGSGSGEGSPIAFLFVLLVVAGIALVVFVNLARQRKKRRARAAKVELASAEAAGDDPHFAADAVKAEAAELHREIVEAWTARDRDWLARHLGPDLLTEWALRLDDFDRKGWHNVCEIKRGPDVEYVGLTNREADHEDRVVVRVTAWLRDVVIDSGGNAITRNGSDNEYTRLAEYWTLGRTEDRWILHSIEQDMEGMHHLEAPIVASPWSDTARLNDEAITELAVADAVPDDEIAGLVDVDYAGDAHTQALDLSVLDGRFAPAVLEAAARRAVAAWAEAVDGADAALERAATPEAAHALLYPRGERTRLVVRGPRLRQLRIAALDAEARTFTVEAELSGRRYLEDRDTAAVLEGSKEHATTFTERWALALGDDPATPWRIVAATPVH
jgi:predicted lipid-binding transport protein (Tim44 family)